MKPTGLTAEAAEKWNKAVELVLEKHPEARSYVELRQKWQALYLLTLNDKQPNPKAELSEVEIRAKMRAAYLALPLAVQRMLVI